jgi:hypothetical protein
MAENGEYRGGMKTVAIVQSNYIPWKGYFDMIAAVDEFILYDDMQYTRRDWRNRNQIKTPQGVQWLTVPVIVKGKYHQLIRETAINGHDWAAKHWATISSNYRRSPHYFEIADWLEPLYCSESYGYLSQLNRHFLEAICRYLSIHTRITDSSNYTLVQGKTERLVDLCIQAGGSRYLSGPSARSYIDRTIFEERGIELTWFDSSGYPSYPQLWGEFVHGVTILDLLFNCGKSAAKYMKYVNNKFPKN